MAKLKDYEVRFRGEFMYQGTDVCALDHESAMQKAVAIRKTIGNFKETDCLIIEQGPGPYSGDWCMRSENGYFDRIPIKIGKEIISGNDRDPQSRLAFAKACEEACQDNEMKTREIRCQFCDFDAQSKKYQKTYEAEEKANLKIQKEHEKKAIIIVAECLKECVMAETFIIIGEATKAGKALSAAEIYWQEAKILSKKSRATGATKPNKAEVTVTNAKKQFDKTAKKIEEFENETRPINKIEELSAA